VGWVLLREDVDREKEKNYPERIKDGIFRDF
jgi:hypothetical protein